MKNKNTLLNDIRQNRIKWLMLVPAAVVIILMCYVPMAGAVLAFKNYNYHDGIFGSPWAGLSNFAYFFKSGKAWSVTRNTILYNLAFLSINTLLQVSCAIFLSEITRKYFKKFTQSVMFLPYFISWVVVGAVVYNLFNYEFGAVNTLLEKLGMAPIDVYSNPKAWIPILICSSLFKNLGYGTVMYLASVINIDPGLYEAADLDGASKVQQFFHITLPMVSPTLFVVLIMRLMSSLKVYDLIYMMVEQSNPALTSAQSLMYLFYRESFVAGNKGYASAIVIWTVLLIGIVTVFQFIGQKKWVNYEV